MKHPQPGRPGKCGNPLCGLDPCPQRVGFAEYDRVMEERRRLREAARKYPQPRYAELEEQANHMAGTLVACTVEIERLQTEREHLIEAASQIQSRLIVAQAHETGWRERAEEAEVECARLRDIAWKHGNSADVAEAEIERLIKERDQFKEWLSRHHGSVVGCGCCGWPDN